MPFSLFLALKFLKPKRSFTSVVTVISVLGVVLGVAIVIIVRAVMTGFGDMWREKILTFKPHVTIQPLFAGAISNDAAVVSAVRKCEGVVAASPSVETRILAEHDHFVTAPILVGVDPEELVGLMPQLDGKLVDGKLSLDDDRVLIGSDLAWQMNLRAGDALLLYSPVNLVSREEFAFPEEVIVGGIYDVGQRDFDSGYVLSSIGLARDILGMKVGAFSINVKTRWPQDPARFTQSIESIRQTIGSQYIVRTWQEIDRELFSALAVEKNMMVILLMFITVVAIFCVTNTLIVITVQRTREIGLLKALGFRSSQIMWAVVLHGWFQCIVGALLGIALAFFVLSNLQNLVDLLARFGLEVFPKNIYGLDSIPWRVLPGEVINVAICVIAFCTLASLVPAARAARMDPVDALRE